MCVCVCVCVCVCEGVLAREFVCNAASKLCEKRLFLIRKINILISLSVRCYLIVHISSHKPKKTETPLRHNCNYYSRPSNNTPQKKILFWTSENKVLGTQSNAKEK